MIDIDAIQSENIAAFHGSIGEVRDLLIKMVRQADAIALNKTKTENSLTEVQKDIATAREITALCQNIAGTLNHIELKAREFQPKGDDDVDAE